MPATEFVVDVLRDGDTAELLLTGDVNGGAETALLDAYHATGEASVVVLDFSGVDYINSTGIALIVGVLAEARKQGRELQARGLAEHYREIFRITRLSDFMTILDEER
jgi:anti-sigma B factor antagonist